MKHLIFILVFLTSLSLHSQSLVNFEKDSLYMDSLCNKECFGDALLLLENTAERYHKNGDNENAIKYRLLKYNLCVKYAKELGQCGYTVDDFYGLIYLIGDLYKENHNIKEYVDYQSGLINIVNQITPNLLPKYGKLVANSFGNLEDEQFCDSIFCLQKVMDYIKNNNPNDSNIETYLTISQSFYLNRDINNRRRDVHSWFHKNKDFILNLNKEYYSKYILEYYFEYAFQSLYEAQILALYHKNNDKAIEIVQSCIEDMNDIEDYNLEVSQKIAYLNIMIAKFYTSLENHIKVREYCEKVLPILDNHIENKEYCDILYQLSTMYYTFRNYSFAQRLLKERSEVLKRIGIKHKPYDYAQQMMQSNDNNYIVFIGEHAAKEISDDELGKENIYLLLAETYSKMAASFIEKSEQDSILTYTNLYNKNINEATRVYQITKAEYNSMNIIDNYYSRCYRVMARHYLRIGDYNRCYEYNDKAIECDNISQSPLLYSRYLDATISSVKSHNQKGIQKYVPVFYEGLENNLRTNLPFLGSKGSEQYLRGHILYKIPEWASWNPKDSVCLEKAYNSALIMKGLNLHYSSFASDIPESDSLSFEIKAINNLRDSLYLITHENEKIILLHALEKRERILRQKLDKTAVSDIFVHWNDVRNTLKEDEVAIELVGYVANNYAWSRDPLYTNYIALVIDNHHTTPVLVELFNQNEIIDVYNLQPKSYSNDIGHQMYKKLWGKLHPYIKNASKVYFSPMGLLSLINLEALMDEDGISAFEHYNLKRLSSTRELLDKTDKEEIKQIALFGGINYTSQNNPIVFSIDSLNTRGNWTFLTNTLNEINTIQSDVSKSSNIKISSYKGFEATESTFKKVCEEYPEIIHIASHGFYINESNRSRIPYYQSEELTDLKDNLFYSGLIFAYGQDTWNNETFKLNADDGILTSYEISQMNLHNTNLVVLSACETGIGDRDFDGIVGLQRAFKMAGVQTIIMSLWKVDDEATSLMMTTFYKELLRTGSKHDAFVYAQKVVKEKYDDPYFWASFVMLD